MAFSDYLDLRTFVLEEARRPELADVFDTLTKLAEARLNQKLRTRDQITETVLTFSDGASYLPSDFAEAIGLYDAQGCEYIQRPYQSTARVYPAHTYSMDGHRVVGPTGDLAFHYYAKLPSLTCGFGESNWLLEKYPSVYLYAVSFEVAKHVRDAEAASGMAQLLGQEMAGMAADDRSARYSRARVRVEGPTP